MDQLDVRAQVHAERRGGRQVVVSSFEKSKTNVYGLTLNKSTQMLVVKLIFAF